MISGMVKEVVDGYYQSGNIGVINGTHMLIDIRHLQFLHRKLVNYIANKVVLF